MKTIPQAAQDYCNRRRALNRGVSEMQAFEAGVNFATHWTSVWDEKPEEMVWVLVKFDTDIPPAVARYTSDGYWNFPYYQGNDAITYWRYIKLQ